MPRCGAEVDGRPVDRDSADLGCAVGGDEGRRWPEEGSAPFPGRRAPELDLVEHIPAIDAVDHDTRRVGEPLVRDVTTELAGRTPEAGDGSRVTRPVWDRRFPAVQRVRRDVGLPDRHERPPAVGLWRR
jgi:hypothetical protein